MYQQHAALSTFDPNVILPMLKVTQAQALIKPWRYSNNFVNWICYLIQSQSKPILKNNNKIKWVDNQIFV